MDPQRSRTSGALETTLFAGRKARWLPLYHRLIARLSRIAGIEVVRNQTMISLQLPGAHAPVLALIKVTTSGLQICLALAKAQVRSSRLKRLAPISAKSKARTTMTHHLLLCEAAELDDEFLMWLKAAKTEARTSTNKSS